jgi:hypothetical protein
MYFTGPQRTFVFSAQLAVDFAQTGLRRPSTRQNPAKKRGNTVKIDDFVVAGPRQIVRF